MWAWNLVGEVGISSGPFQSVTERIHVRGRHLGLVTKLHEPIPHRHHDRRFFLDRFRASYLGAKLSVFLL